MFSTRWTRLAIGVITYPLLEGPLATDPDQRRLIINELDTHRRAFTGKQWYYRLEAPASTGQSIGDMTAVNKRMFLVTRGGRTTTSSF